MSLDNARIDQTRIRQKSTNQTFLFLLIIRHVQLDQTYVKQKSTNQKLTLGLILHVHFLLFDYGRIDQTRINEIRPIKHFEFDYVNARNLK